MQNSIWIFAVKDKDCILKDRILRKRLASEWIVKHILGHEVDSQFNGAAEK